MADNSIDAVVTDPPAGISFMNKAFDSDRGGRDQWIAWLAEIMREALRVTKPGGHAFIWALPRTSHWTATAIEDAGWQIRDVCHHIFGSGFPKSKSMRDIDRPELGTALKPAVENWILCRKPLSESSVSANVLRWGTGALNIDQSRIGTDTIRTNGNPAASHSRRNLAHGARPYANGIKDNHVPSEHTGRWPANVILSHSLFCVPVGTRRVKGSGFDMSRPDRETGVVYGEHRATPFVSHADADGYEVVEAWECDESCPVRLLDAQSGNRPGMPRTTARTGLSPKGYGIGVAPDDAQQSPGYGDIGGASRFFKTIAYSPDEVTRFRYQAKAPRSERVLSNHPTQKPVALMRYLVQLVTPPGGVVLDPFAGSGTTLVACAQLGFACIGIEKEPDYVAIIERRLQHAKEAA